MKCRFGQVQIGTVLPCSNARYLLNITILPEMEISEYVPCDFSGFYESLEAAEDGVCTFLTEKRR